MPTYIAKERGQIPVDDAQPANRPEATGRRVVHRIVEAGEVFEFNGKPGRWMERVAKGEKGVPGPKPSGARETSTTTNEPGEQG
ncbi:MULTISPECIES: hypothetical protein [unclassified Paraburkholderia]|uniref:hypothetical protein n=1 Tax=unclassified Paraburkholderia TaxID=2615204 RepID=UPI002AB1D134|nr:MULTISPECIES: hypothetical protein [unclassified Paraburkholderia]